MGLLLTYVSWIRQKPLIKLIIMSLNMKLMKRNLLSIFLRILINWYSKCYDNVRWDNVLSRVFFYVL